MSIGPFPTLLQGVRLEALDALMYTFHTPQLNPPLEWVEFEQTCGKLKL